MSSDNTALGDRMKGYEAVTRYVLPRRTYTIIRVDGRAFHSYLRGRGKPFDEPFMVAMDQVAIELCREISGARFAYTQSDEVSVLVTDFTAVQTHPWLGGGVQKLASVSAAIATMAFNEADDDVPAGRLATFDGRVFTIPDPVEVANYFLWRQRDAVRNSISMAAQANFPHKRLQGLDGDQMQELLWQEKGINWNDYPDGVKRGRVCQRVTVEAPVTYTDKRTQQEKTITAVRSRWEVTGAPRFSAGAGFLADMIPRLPALAEEEISQ